MSDARERAEQQKRIRERMDALRQAAFLVKTDIQSARDRYKSPRHEFPEMSQGQVHDLLALIERRLDNGLGDDCSICRGRHGLEYIHEAE